MFAPWFGELPFYARTFLGCCATSKNILWIIHSDQKPIEIPSNVLWFTCNNVSERIGRVFDKDIVPHKSWKHKLCDLKPFWHLMFSEPDFPAVEFRGWCDWDVVHDLSTLDFTFESAKFTSGGMCSPLFITRKDNALEWYPINPKVFLASDRSLAWDELRYLKNIHSTIIQPGLTPEVDLVEAASYAVHMCRAKHCPVLYQQWIERYFHRIAVESQNNFIERT